MHLRSLLPVRSDRIDARSAGLRGFMGRTYKYAIIENNGRRRSVIHVELPYVDADQHDE